MVYAVGRRKHTKRGICFEICSLARRVLAVYWKPPTHPAGVQPGLSAELRSAARVDIITSLSTAVCQRVLYSFWMALSADWLPPVALMPQARQCHLSWQIPSKF